MTPGPIPVVLVIAGSDPTGGAGIQADIEAIASMGCHPAPVIAAVTVQDTTNVLTYSPQPGASVSGQCRAVLEDIAVAGIKIGLLGSIEVIEAIVTVVGDYPRIPVTLDPVMIAGGGTEMYDEEILTAVRERLLPLCTMVTPNTTEARLLAPGAGTLDTCAGEILDAGARYALITGTHDDTREVINRLYTRGTPAIPYAWTRLPGSYHGSGCTLASSLSALLARGWTPEAAAKEAQDYTWKTLHHALRIGSGQLIPNRLFWGTHTPS